MMLDFIPLPHKVTILKASDQLDSWGLPVSDAGSETDYRARILFNTKRETLTVSTGEEITFTATMLLEGLPAVEYSDLIVWTDGFNREHRLSPLEIDYKQDMSGEPIAVKVVV